ncbi:hypothetical protein [Pseudomonas sp. TCU-HL1]|uniref:hypothetical protein n=1 Tax=Pseudomonas sp. TCU-HL1 TaxID=1856685 RepID=UPI00083D3675|nr:hypothetical protein [Pseudomonas sp. TCU-HL1]AOE87667.1 hypothetical protein THL1_5119 [Pseudomonas sp. TCU-HL1]
MSLHDRRPQAPTREPLFKSLPPALHRALRWRLLFLAVALGSVLLLSLLSRAHASGGAYRVDDAAINSPGECNLDAWHQRDRHQGNHYQSVLSPACTFIGLPEVQVQLGTALAREGEAGERHTRLSPELKTLLASSEELGLALALALSADVYLDRRHGFEGGGINLPLTYQPAEPLRLNAGLGYSHAYADGDRNNRWNWGMGLEYGVGEPLTLIAERFCEADGERGWQAGPRLHLGERLDIDLVFGGHLNGERQRWLGSGATLRF